MASALPPRPLCSFVTGLLKLRIFRNSDHDHKFRLDLTHGFPQPPDGFIGLFFMEFVVDMKTTTKLLAKPAKSD